MLLLTAEQIDDCNAILPAAVYVCEQHLGVELNQALVEYQIGKTQSYALPLDNLARLADQL